MNGLRCGPCGTASDLLQEQLSADRKGTDMNLKSLEVFYWVVKLGSFNKAAAKQNTTQPAVSQRIAALEAELGIKVLHRSTRAIALTAKGRALFDYAERLVTLKSEILMNVADKSALSGTIRLGVAETIVHTWLVDFLEEAQRNYPDITIDVVVDITPSLRPALASGELDIAFLLGPNTNSELVEEKLCSYELNFIASPALKLPARPLSNSELTAHPLIMLPKLTYPYTYLRKALTTIERGPPRILTHWSLSTIVRMTEDGFGIGVLPKLAIAKELKQKRLRIQKTNLHLQNLTFAVAYARESDEVTKLALADLARSVAKNFVAGARNID